MAPARGDRVRFRAVKKASRVFALLYSVGAGVLAFLLLGSAAATVPWLSVCLSAMMLGFVAVAWRPVTLLCAAHAGLTVTWAGTLAPSALADSAVMTSVVSLLVLGVGMTVMIGFGLKFARPAAVRTSPPR
jgi:hypothetical protein